MSWMNLVGDEMLGKCEVCNEYSVSIDNGEVSCFGCKVDKENNEMDENFDEVIENIMNEWEDENKKKKEMLNEYDEVRDKYWVEIYRRLDCLELEIGYIDRDREKVWNEMMKSLVSYLGSVKLEVGDELKVEIVRDYWIKVGDGFEWLLKSIVKSERS